MLEIVDTQERFEEIREEWMELLSHSSSDCVFLTWEWLYTWWKHLAGGRRLHIVAIRSGTMELIAIAPLASPSTTLIRFAHIRALEFLGTGSVGSDYLDIIARRGMEDEAMDILERYFLREKFVLDLKQVKHQSLALELAARLQQGRWNRSEIRTNICPFIDLTGLTWTSFKAGLGPKHRYNFHRRLKNLYREFDASFECVVSEDQRHAALVTLVVLHNKRMEHRGGSDGLHSPALVAFHEELTRLALARGWLRLFVLRLNGDKAAALYGFMYGTKFYFYQSGFDPRYSGDSVGLVTMGLTIEAAIQDGAEEFDLLHGDEKYKSLWAKQQRDLMRTQLSPPTPRAWIYTKAIALNRVARRAARVSLTMLRSPIWSQAK